MLICFLKLDDKTEYKWAFQFPNILMYDKSNCNFECECNNIKVESLNRSYIHSLFHYIYNNYENLDNYTIFITLDNTTPTHENSDCGPSPGSDAFIERLWSYINNEDELTIDFDYIASRMHIVSTDNIIDDDYMNNLNNSGFPDLTKNEIEDEFKKIYTILFGNFEKIDIPCIEGLNSIVSKNTILSNPKSYYYNILQLLENDTENIIRHEIIYNNYFLDCLYEKMLTKKIRNNYSLYTYKDEDTVVINNRNINDIVIDTNVNEVFVNADETTINTDELELIIDTNVDEVFVNADETTINTDDGVVVNVGELYDTTNPFESDDICFRPPNGYCDYCNVIASVKKPVSVSVYMFCCDKCNNDYYQNSVAKKNT